MTQREQQTVLELLTENIRDDYGEARPDRLDLPQRAVDNAIPASLRASVEIHEELSQLVDPSHIRTRYVGVRTSSWAYGLSYFRAPIISKATNGTNTEIQSVCLPTKPKWQGILEVYFSGHDEPPVQSTDIHEEARTRAGQPVFRVRNAPTPQFVRETIGAFSRSSILGLRT